MPGRVASVRAVVGQLESVRAPSVSGELILDECPRGDGLWFDRGELEALLEALLGDDRRRWRMCVVIWASSRR